MGNATYVAVWGMGSLIVAFVAACVLVIAAIWNAETAVKVCASVIVMAMFSLAAALFVQGAIDRQAAKAEVSTPQPNVDEGDGK